MAGHHLWCELTCCEYASLVAARFFFFSSVQFQTRWSILTDLHSLWTEMLKEDAMLSKAKESLNLKSLEDAEKHNKSRLENKRGKKIWQSVAISIPMNSAKIAKMILTSTTPIVRYDHENAVLYMPIFYVKSTSKCTACRDLARDDPERVLRWCWSTTPGHRSIQKTSFQREESSHWRSHSLWCSASICRVSTITQLKRSGNGYSVIGDTMCAILLMITDKLIH